MQWGEVRWESGCVGGGGGKDEDIAKQERVWGGRRGRGRWCWMGCDVIGLKCGREGQVAPSDWGGVGLRYGGVRCEGRCCAVCVECVVAWVWQLGLGELESKV